ncbi:MAG: outer membrane protein [Myxococcota bacterium]
MSARPTRAPRLAPLGLATLLALLLGAGSAAAQNLYLEGHFGGSEGTIDTTPDGVRVLATDVDASEDDDDASIVGGASMGFRFPLTWALDTDLPRWMPDIHFRLEEEFAYGRDYDIFTENGFDRSNVENASSLEAWSLMTNLLVEIPVYRSWAVVGGVGLGPAFLDGKLRNSFNELKGEDDDVRFAWQGMAGIEYAFDETVTMGFGYRFFDAEELKVNLSTPNPPRPRGEMEFDLDAHEFMVRLRVNFYHFE